MRINVVAYEKDLYIKKLVEWKNSAGRKPLILNGARSGRQDLAVARTGRKRVSARGVCQLPQKRYCQAGICTQDFDVECILRSLRAMTGVDITPHVR